MLTNISRESFGKVEMARKIFYYQKNIPHSCHCLYIHDMKYMLLL